MGIVIGLVPLLIVGGLAYALFVWVRRSGAADDEEFRTTTRPGRISLLGEAIGYIGVILVLAGGGAAIGQRWDELSETARISVIAGAAAGFLAVGIMARRSTEPALIRLSAVVWLVSTIGVAVTAALIATWTYDLEERAVVTAAALSATVYGAILWAVDHKAAQHLALYGAGLMLVTSSVAWISDGEVPSGAFALVAWGFGVAWAIGAWRRLLQPWWVGVPLGAVTAMIAPTAIRTDAGAYALGLTTAAAIMAASVSLRLTPGLAIGALGLFGYVTGAVVHYFRDTLGVPAALALTGVAILVIAVIATRLVDRTRPSPTREQMTKPPLRRAS